MKNMDVYLVVVFLVVIAGLGYLVVSQKSTLEDKSEPQEQLTDLTTRGITDESIDTQESPQESSQSEESSDGIIETKMTLQDKLSFQKPAMVIDSNKKYTANIKTSEGNFTIELFADKTPVTVNNFVALSKAGFYNDIIFHRVLTGFMIQTGDPVGTGTGGPAYKFDDEPFEGEYTKGTVAMARSAQPNSNGSQFFIIHEDYPLPKDYIIFGKVTEGLETIDKIAETKVQSSSMGEPSSPINPPKILSVEISEE